MPTQSRRDEKKARVLELIGEGLTIIGAAGLAGIDRQTIYNWRDADSAFSAALREAEDRAQGIHESRIVRAGAEDWRASKAWLERRRASDWGRVERVEQSGSIEVVVRRGGTQST